MAEETKPTTIERIERSERLVGLALKAAVIGLIYLPGILHVYSLVLLIQAWQDVALLPAKIRGRYWAAFGLDALVLTILALILGVIALQISSIETLRELLFFATAQELVP